jgi:hypothetical protein
LNNPGRLAQLLPAGGWQQPMSSIELRACVSTTQIKTIKSTACSKGSSMQAVCAAAHSRACGGGSGTPHLACRETGRLPGRG